MISLSIHQLRVLEVVVEEKIPVTFSNLEADREFSEGTRTFGGEIL